MPNRRAGSEKAILEVPCGADRARTGDLLVANQSLYQLSYSPAPASLGAAGAALVTAPARRHRARARGWRRARQDISLTPISPSTEPIAATAARMSDSSSRPMQPTRNESATVSLPG